jgi:hypothetical protein
MKNPSPHVPVKPTAKELRQQRLAQALRENLRRRKGLKTPDAVKEDEV